MKIYYVKLLIDNCVEDYYIIAKDRDEAKDKINKTFDFELDDVLEMKLISDMVIL